MLIYTEEKKQSVCVRGVSAAACRLLYPRAEGKEQISAFYEKTAENLLAFFLETANERAKDAPPRSRAARRGREELRMNMFFSVAYSDESILSIAWEYALFQGKSLLAYKKSGEIWATESELLLPAKYFFPRGARKKAESGGFYFDGEAVLIENTFPEAAAPKGRRARLSDYVKETRFKAPPLRI